MYDVIVIGAGHNGLVTAVTLSQAGYKVLVLEQRAHLGGVATTEEIFPGYQINVGAHDAALLSDQVVQALFLRMYGLAWQQNPVTIFAPQPDGTALTLWHDTAKNLIEISGLSREDARQFPVFKQEVEQIA